MLFSTLPSSRLPHFSPNIFHLCTSSLSLFSNLFFPYISTFNSFPFVPLFTTSLHSHSFHFFFYLLVLPTSIIFPFPPSAPPLPLPISTSSSFSLPFTHIHSTGIIQNYQPFLLFFLSFLYPNIASILSISSFHSVSSFNSSAVRLLNLFFSFQLSHLFSWLIPYISLRLLWLI